jgi:hypothetical protein
MICNIHTLTPSRSNTYIHSTLNVGAGDAPAEEKKEKPKEEEVDALEGGMDMFGGGGGGDY